jgi:hypothetical protein
VSDDKRTRPVVPPLFVERVHVGEGSDAERARVKADAKDALDALRVDNARFLLTHDPDPMLARIAVRAKEAAARDALAERSSSRARWALPVLALGALVAAVVVGPAMVGDRLGAGEIGAEDRTKGLEAAVRLFRHRSGRTDRVVNGQVLFEGDEIQIATVGGSATHGVVVSVDGRGNVTRHFPAGASTDTALPRGEVFLPTAFRLDDAPDYERFVMVWGDAPIDVAAVEAAARGLGVERPLPGFDHQKSVVVRKGVKE